jgi:sodium/proline symporter
MTRSATATLILLAFLAVVLTITVWAARRTHNAADFLLANRRLGVWLVALSYSANAVNAWMLILMSATAFAWGLSAVWVWGAVLFGCLVNLWFVAPRLRAISGGQGGTTLIQILSADAGDRMQPLIVRSAVFILVIALLLQIGAILRSGGSMLAEDFGFDLDTVVITTLVVTLVCVFAGGLRAASSCDAVQTGIVMAVALLLPLPALIAIGGWSELPAAVAALGPNATDWFAGKSGVVAVAFAAGVFGIGLAMSGQPHVVNRFMAAKDEGTLRAARWLALAWVAVLLGAVLMCGWCAGVLYAGLEHPEQALFAIASRLLPPWLAATIVLMLAVAILSNVGSQLLVLAAGVAVDLRRTTSPLSLPLLRTGLVIATIAAGCVALYVPASLLDQAMFAFHALGASFGPLLLVRLSGKRIRPGSTLGAMWSGFVLSFLFHLLPDAPGDFLERVLPFIAALGIALTGGERRRNPDRADRAQETVHDRVPI